jgi:hypothetical protein
VAEQVLLSVRRGWAHARCRPKKECFTLLKLLCTPTNFMTCAFANEKCAALFQAATDGHWGADCSKLTNAISIHNFNRHFQIARSTAFKMHMILFQPIAWLVVEKTGNVQDCIEINDQTDRAMESHMRAAPPAVAEVSFSLFGRGAFVGVEAHHQHLQPRDETFRVSLSMQASTTYSRPRKATAPLLNEDYCSQDRNHRLTALRTYIMSMLWSLIYVQC